MARERWEPEGDDMAYEAPTLIRIGSIAEFTHGGQPYSFGDGVSWRGPRLVDPDPSS